MIKDMWGRRKEENKRMCVLKKPSQVTRRALSVVLTLKSVLLTYSNISAGVLDCEGEGEGGEAGHERWREGREKRGYNTHKVTSRLPRMYHTEIKTC